MKDNWSAKLFGVKQTEGYVNTNEEIINIPITLIDRSAYQPRENIDVDKVNELAQSIKTYGLLQPIVLRKAGERYEIVAGERRFLALKKLKKDYVKAIVKEYSDSEMAALAMIENLQRENLNIIEEARGYKKLIDEFNLTQEVLAQRLGKSQSTIANKIRLLNLPEEIKKAISGGYITERHARSLLKLQDEKQQLELLSKIVEKSLNVKQTEEEIEKMLNSTVQDNSKKTEDIKRKKGLKRGVVKDHRIFVNTINKAISAIREAGIEPEVKEENYEDRIEIKISLPKNIS
ncbi:nucleoid occlusion protein [Natranaerofaba carboxydovora]|uniref:nucleoid occlusion protein n=1 Tax=Natranaerofaba carboxydovora TaxID=2742683 RepID=UPI001F12954A|nr:nucleoid occlusion protein [Natranaerofaba carboxydovora]UMZ75179.1 Nucleoid occlusion protein [Natranaerofaba carboxydovora]